jgi:DNA polymerase-1
MDSDLSEFDSIHVVDFEFHVEPGGLPKPLCAVGLEIRTGTVHSWRSDRADEGPVYTFGPRDLVVAYAAEAEGGCIRALRWPMPEHCIDLYTLFRMVGNSFTGERPKASLLSALDYFGLQRMDAATKQKFRDLAIGGAALTEDEMHALLLYCEEDVRATASLLPHLLRSTTATLGQALLMGRYTLGAVSSIQHAGVPVNLPLLRAVFDNRDTLLARTTAAIDQDYCVFDGTSFRIHEFEKFLVRENIPWPRLSSGAPCLDDDTFKVMAHRFPRLEPLRQLRKFRNSLRSVKWTTGRDGRNRTSLRPFASRTGRNQPRSSECLYLWPGWTRHMIAPPRGKVLLSLDYEQQEFLIGAALAGDANMLSAYKSGDPYLHTAKLARAVPPDATKETHPSQRGQYKTLALAMQYGVSVAGLTKRLGDSSLANELDRQHRQLFRRYHRWCEDAINTVTLGCELRSPFGWVIRRGDRPHETNLRSVINWPVQAAGADMLRIAATAIVEHGIEVVALVHDSVVVLADEDCERDVSELAQRLMAEASEAVLVGHACRVEARATRYGGSYCGEPEPEMLRLVKGMLHEMGVRYV